jgi:Uma2 family endonuclease
MIAEHPGVASPADLKSAEATERVGPRRFTSAEYHTMIAAGILQEDERVELVAGEIVQMTPIGSGHAGCVKRLNRLLTRGLDDRAVVSVQDPIALGPASEPQPDLALLRPRADDYGQSHPQAQDVVLVIEVADTSVAYDRDVKIPLYAEGGIPEAWLVRLTDRCIEVYRDPAATGYQSMQTFRTDDLSPLAFPDLALTVETILG